VSFVPLFASDETATYRFATFAALLACPVASTDALELCPSALAAGNAVVGLTAAILTRLSERGGEGGLVDGWTICRAGWRA
jgi:hypothetical protein